MSKQFKIDIYADGADFNEMRQVFQYGFVDGFTTNPSLMKKAGVNNYLSFAQKVVAEFPAIPISFEVFSNDFLNMEKEAKIISALGENVFVKIPVLTVQNQSTKPLIAPLSRQGIAINVTAVTTIEQVQAAISAFSKGSSNIISIFVGRLADTGINPKNFVKESAQLCQKCPEAKLLWASTREVQNVYEAAANNVDIITVPPNILSKLRQVGETAEQVSLDTVQGFAADIKQLGFSILD